MPLTRWAADTSTSDEQIAFSWTFFRLQSGTGQVYQQHLVAAGEILVEIGRGLRREGHRRRATNLFQVGRILTAEAFGYRGQAGLGLETDPTAFDGGKSTQVDQEVGLGRGASTILQVELDTVLPIEHELPGLIAAVPVFHGRHRARVIIGPSGKVNEQTGFQRTTGSGVVRRSSSTSLAGWNYWTVRGRVESRIRDRGGIRSSIAAVTHFTVDFHFGCVDLAIHLRGLGDLTVRSLTILIGDFDSSPSQIEATAVNQAGHADQPDRDEQIQ